MNKDTEFYFKMIAGIGAFIMWMVFFFSNAQDKSVLLWISIGLTVFFIVYNWRKRLSVLFKQQAQVQKNEPMSKEELAQRLESDANEHLSNIVQGVNPRRFTHILNDYVICAIRVLLRPDDEEKIFILNLSNPKLPTTILDGNASDFEIKMAMGSMAGLKEPDREITQISLDEFRQPVKRTEKITNKKEEEKKEEEVIG